MINEDVEKINLELSIINQRLDRELKTLKWKIYGLAAQLDKLDKQCSCPTMGFQKEHSDQLQRISRELKDLMNE